MICIKCTHNDTQVVNSRMNKKTASVWRRRRCPSCRAVFSTYEQPAQNAYPIVENRGSKCTFSIPRLAASIQTDMSPSNDQADIAYALASTTAQKLLIDRPRSLTSRDISKVAYNTIKAYDPACGVRYGLRVGVLRPANQPRNKNPGRL